MMKSQTIFEIQARLCQSMGYPIRLEIVHSLRDRQKFVNELSDRANNLVPTDCRVLTIGLTAIPAARTGTLQTPFVPTTSFSSSPKILEREAGVRSSKQSEDYEPSFRGEKRVSKSLWQE